MLVAAAGLALCAAATAQVFSRSDYEGREQAIAVRHLSAQRACTPLVAQAQDVCVAQAEAEMRIARSDLAAHYRPSARARHHARMVAADSRLAVARVRCESGTGVARTTCVASATALRTEARDQAREELNAAEARARATEQADEDREEAASDTFAARYGAARRQCDGYVDKLRELCLAQTRDQFLRQP